MRRVDIVLSMFLWCCTEAKYADIGHGRHSSDVDPTDDTAAPAEDKLVLHGLWNGGDSLSFEWNPISQAHHDLTARVTRQRGELRDVRPVEFLST